MEAKGRIFYCAWVRYGRELVEYDDAWFDGSEGAWHGDDSDNGPDMDEINAAGAARSLASNRILHYS